ncbi:Uncharacterised protein [Chlamydia trachomatis]|nr:Uncharacterised protein [Chlamydia trachomatis]
MHCTSQYAAPKVAVIPGCPSTARRGGKAEGRRLAERVGPRCTASIVHGVERNHETT